MYSVIIRKVILKTEDIIMIILRPIRLFLLQPIYWLVSILVAVRSLYCQFCDNTCLLPENQDLESDISILLKNVPNMKKKLEHLVILVNTNVHSMKNLAQLVIWSLILGVPYVSFHDITGRLKKCEDDLFVEIERNKKGIAGCIKWRNRSDLNGYTNGTKANTVYINIFSINDGRFKITQCVKLIAKGEMDCAKSSAEFTEEELHDTLVKLYPSMPEPNLILYTGPLCCSFGFLPWQIRLTEFIQLSVNHNFTINDYLDSLYKYNERSQRFGK